MKSLFLIIYFIFIQSFLINNANAIENKILFKVNNDIITSLDVYDEIKYLNSINANFSTLNKEKQIEIAKIQSLEKKLKKLKFLKE